MPPQLATVVFFAGIVGLFLMCRESEVRTSPSLWLPVIWIAIGGSRNISNWLYPSTATVAAEAYLDGSPLDRAILSGLICGSILILISRGRRITDVLGQNVPLMLFFLYCLCSVMWSDYPFVTLKHWTKVLGNFTMVLIVLTDPGGVTALKRFVTRAAFVLIPASVLIIRYFPEMGRYYDQWEGKAFYSGVTENKNMLGATCLVLGLGIMWRFIDTFHETEHRARRLLALGIVLAMNLWLLHIADSATSVGCFLLGGTVIVVLGLSTRERSKLVHLMTAGLVAIAAIVYLFQDAFAFLVGSLGRNTTLTGRTELWNDVLQMDKHPWLGAGFESFFLGERLEFLWIKHWWHPTEAHNGYLDTYLTLGIIGLGFLGMLLITGYFNATNVYRNDPRSGGLRLAIVLIAPIYNITEAAFKVMNPVWIFFLLAVTALPVLRLQEAATPADAPRPGSPDRWPALRKAGLGDAVTWANRGLSTSAGRAVHDRQGRNVQGVAADALPATRPPRRGEAQLHRPPTRKAGYGS
jgi:exopolysaccharide production protein ExoQ